jgi:FKBP-type peptidyl-prolyl cis-trans isomerase
MKVMMTIAMVAMFSIACNAQQEDVKVDLESKKDSASYSLGVNIGSSLLQQGIEIDANIVASGIVDAMAGESKLTDEQVQAVLMALQEDAAMRQADSRAEKGTEAAKKSEAFLAANKAKDGVMTTPSGLQYKVVTEGTGKKPAATDQVSVHYTGTLIDGTKFDSSHDRGAPAQFALNQVIPGWTEGLQLMTVGSTYMLYIPPTIGYGENGAGASIGPNEALIFEVELLEILDEPSK